MFPAHLQVNWVPFQSHLPSALSWERHCLGRSEERLLYTAVRPGLGEHLLHTNSVPQSLRSPASLRDHRSPYQADAEGTGCPWDKERIALTLD